MICFICKINVDTFSALAFHYKFMHFLDPLSTYECSESNCSQTFQNGSRIDATRKPLQPRYDGPFAVLERKDKTFKLQLHNRTSWISIDRLTPAFILREDPIADHSYASTLSEIKTRSINVQQRQKQVRFFFPRGW